MPIGLKSGFKKNKILDAPADFFFSEAAKIKQNLSTCVGASAAVVESMRHVLPQIPQNAQRYQPRYARVCGLSQKEGECSFPISGNIAPFLPTSIARNIPLI